MKSDTKLHCKQDCEGLYGPLQVHVWTDILGVFVLSKFM